MKLLSIFFSLAFALPSIAQTSIQQVDCTVEAFLKLDQLMWQALEGVSFSNVDLFDSYR